MNDEPIPLIFNPNTITTRIIYKKGGSCKTLNTRSLSAEAQIFRYFSW